MDKSWYSFKLEKIWVDLRFFKGKSVSRYDVPEITHDRTCSQDDRGMCQMSFSS